MNVRKYLEFFETLSDAYCIEDVKPLSAGIRQKMADEKLYLAVVGEFSSGKSTFINALLGRRLLKEAVMPTTACATYISKGGDAIEINVSFAGAGFCVGEHDMSGLNDYLKEHYGVVVTDMQSLVDILTSEQAVACDVKSLSISIPDINIPDNIVIIDTPGFNPGDVSVNNHFEITKDVVTRCADAALVLMPSDLPFSNSVKIFMQDYLKDYLHRCVFVMTMGDHKDAHERETIVGFVKDRLRKDFKLEKPKVFCESAITMLPVVKIPDILKNDWSMWQSEFRAFEQYVWQLLTGQKNIILSEHAHHLSLKLTKRMQNSLAAKQTDFEQEKTRLEQSRVKRIREVTSQLQKDACDKISGSFAQLDEVLAAEIRREKKECKVVAAPYFAKDCASTAFLNEIQTPVSNDVKKRASAVLEKINKKIEADVKKSIKDNVAFMRSEFDRHYVMFPSIEPKENVLKYTIENIKMPRINFKNVKDIFDDINDKSGNRFMIGIGGGAATGALVGGPVGAIIGGIAGFIFGGMSSDKLHEKKVPTLKSAGDREINRYFNSLQANIKKKITEKNNEINAAVNDYADRHVLEYGAAVESLIKRQENDLSKAKQNIESLKIQIRSLEDIEHEIKYELVRMKEQQ